jgi:Fic family protein
MTNFVRLNYVIMKKFSEIIKERREEKGFIIREIAEMLSVDPTLVSRFERGYRKPTKEQVYKLANILDLDATKLMVQWLAESILYEIGDDDMALEAMKVAEEEIKYIKSKTEFIVPKRLTDILKEIDEYKAKIDKVRHLDSYRIAQALELEYTYNSNKIEGNTLTLQETDLVVNEGITISGKSMREHLEAINHQEAIDYIKELAKGKITISERVVLDIHRIVLKSIQNEYAGKYRNVQVMIKGSKHVPPQPFLVPKHMEEYFMFYMENKNRLHPVLLAAEMHEKLVTIHPFIDGNGRTSRLLMNLILLANGYVIANIKGDLDTRLKYYNALETVQVNNSKDKFLELVAETELEAIKYYYEILGSSDS